MDQPLPRSAAVFALGAASGIGAAALVSYLHGGGRSDYAQVRSASAWQRVFKLLQGGGQHIRGDGAIDAAARNKVREAAEARAALAAGGNGRQHGAIPRAEQRQPPGNGAAAEADEDDEILAEQFTRNTQFFGKDGQRRVADAFVVVIGLGVRSLPAHQ
jgi:hypothetical protein